MYARSAQTNPSSRLHYFKLRADDGTDHDTPSHTATKRVLYVMSIAMAVHELPWSTTLIKGKQIREIRALTI